MKLARWYVTLAGCFSLGCDDGVLRAFEPRSSMLGEAAAPGRDPEPGGGSGGGGDGGGGGGSGTGSTQPVAGGGSGGASSPLLIDDFEDGDARAKEPRGWWYPINDGTGTQGFGIEPIGSGGTSVYALRAHGSGFELWGAAVGVNLVGESTPVNALSHEQLCFAARVEAGSNTAVRVLFAREKDQSYSQELSLSQRWARYCLPLRGFAAPDDTALAPNELIALQFFFPPPAPFAVWLDDVEIVP